MKTCDTFTPFPRALDVCDTCGNLASAHTPVKAESQPDYVRAMWKVMIAKGGFHDGFGHTLNVGQTIELRKHMKRCGVDFTKTREPRMDTVYEFDGTDCDSKQVAAITGTLYCKCNKYRYSTVAILDMTLGQLIWHTVHADD